MKLGVLLLCASLGLLCALLASAAAEPARMGPHPTEPRLRTPVLNEHQAIWPRLLLAAFLGPLPLLAWLTAETRRARRTIALAALLHTLALLLVLMTVAEEDGPMALWRVALLPAAAGLLTLAFASDAKPAAGAC